MINMVSFEKYGVRMNVVSLVTSNLHVKPGVIGLNLQDRNAKQSN